MSSRGNPIDYGTLARSDGSQATLSRIKVDISTWQDAPASCRYYTRTGYKYNLSGRSVKGCGAFGRSNSPASHSGMDPNLPRGKSSQLDFEMCANED